MKLVDITLTENLARAVGYTIGSDEEAEFDEWWFEEHGVKKAHWEHYLSMDDHPIETGWHDVQVGVEGMLDAFIERELMSTELSDRIKADFRKFIRKYVSRVPDNNVLLFSDQELEVILLPTTHR